MRKSIILPVLLAMTTITIPATYAVAQDIPKVTVAQVDMVEFIGRVAITGTLVAREEAMVNPRVNGQQIISVLADVGDLVKKGQLLAELDRETLDVQAAQASAELERSKAAVAQAKAQLALSAAKLSSATITYERDKTLLSTGTVTKAKFDQSDTAYRTAQASEAATKQGLAVVEAQVQQARIRQRLATLNLSYTRITAPAAGMISSRNASLGEVASVGPKPLFRIIRDNQIEVKSDVIETDIARIEIGDSVTLNIAGVGRVAGTVRQISPRVDPKTRLGEVRVSLPSDQRQRVGIFASGYISTTRFSGIGVPASAILTDANGEFAQLVDKSGIVHKQSVKTGLLWKGMREIREGLSKGDVILLLAGAFFQDGDHVAPISANRTSK
jgi:RND family efflux transporter MFP subunit